MAIQTAQIGNTPGPVYISVNQTAITLMSICNYSIATRTVSIHIVSQADVSPADSNIFIKDVEIVPGDTFIIYQGGEKIILEDGDHISMTADGSNALTAITSYMEV